MAHDCEVASTSENCAFVGSGITQISAEQIQCNRGIEIEPHDCDVTIRRLRGSGIEAVKIERRTGKDQVLKAANGEEVADE